MTKTFDPTKPVRTRGGTPARILTCDLMSNSELKIVAALHEEPYAEYVRVYYADGQLVGEVGREHPDDLVNVPEETEKFFSLSMSNELFDEDEMRAAAKNGCSVVRVVYLDGKVHQVFHVKEFES